MERIETTKFENGTVTGGHEQNVMNELTARIKEIVLFVRNYLVTQPISKKDFATRSDIATRQAVRQEIIKLLYGEQFENGQETTNQICYHSTNRQRKNYRCFSGIQKGIWIGH